MSTVEGTMPAVERAAQAATPGRPGPSGTGRRPRGATRELGELGRTCRAAATGLALCLALVAGGTLVSLAGQRSRWLQVLVLVGLVGLVAGAGLRMMSRRR
jgi:hypothetical protein